MIERFCKWYLAINNENKRVQFRRNFRLYIWVRDKGLCQYCGRYLEPNETFHIDHIYPFSRGGDNEEDNLVLSCPICNLKKGAKQILPTGYYQPPNKFYQQFLKIILKVKR